MGIRFDNSLLNDTPLVSGPEDRQPAAEMEKINLALNPQAEIKPESVEKINLTQIKAPEIVNQAPVEKINLGPTKLEQSYNTVQNDEPDRSSRVSIIARENKVSPIYVDANLKDVEKAVAAPDKKFWTAYEMKNKKATTFLSDPEMMSQAKDDLDNIALNEDLTKAFSMAKNWSILAYAQTAKMFVQTPALAYNLFKTPENIIFNRPADKQVSMSTKNFASDYWDRIIQKENEKNDWGKIDFASAWESGNYEQAAKKIISNVAVNSPMTIMALAAAAVGQPEVGLAAISSLSAASALEEAQKAGVSPVKAIGHAAVSGTAEGIFETAEVGTVYRLAKNIVAKNLAKEAAKQGVYQGIKNFGKAAAGAAITEYTGEFLTSLVQDESAYRFDVNPKAREGMLIRAHEAGLTGAVSGVGMTAPVALMQAKSKTDLKNKILDAKVQHNLDTYDALMELHADSKFAKRNPEAHGELTKVLVQDTGMENIYLNVEGAETYFQSKGINTREVMRDMGVEESYNQALQSGDPIVIPTESWVKTMAPTEHAKALKNDLSLDSETPSPNEYKAAEEQAKIDVEELMKQVKENPEIQSEYDAVYEDVKQKMMQAKGPFETMSEKQYEKTVDETAKIWQQYITTEAAKRKVGIKELHEELVPSFKYQQVISGPGRTQQSINNEQMLLDHYSNQEFNVANPAYQYTGQPGAEKKGKGVTVPKIHYYVYRTQPEAQFKYANNKYRAVVESSKIYNMEEDKLNIYPAKGTPSQEEIARMEKKIMAAGYNGVKVGNTVVMYKKQNVHKLNRFFLSIAPRVNDMDKLLIDTSSLFTSPLLDVVSINEAEGRFQGTNEFSVDAEVEAADDVVLRGAVAQFLRANDQQEGYISKLSKNPYEFKAPNGIDENVQAASQTIGFDNLMSEVELKKLSDILKTHGIDGYKFVPELKRAIIHHIPKYLSKQDFLDNMARAKIQINNVFNDKGLTFGYAWFNHDILERKDYDRAIKEGRAREEALGYKPLAPTYGATKGGISRIFQEQILGDNQTQTRYQPTVSELGLYSFLEKSIEEMDFKSIPARDLINRINSLKQKGLKKEELVNSELIDWLEALDKSENKKVLKENVLEFLKRNPLHLAIRELVREEGAEEKYDEKNKERLTHEDIDWDESPRIVSPDRDAIDNEAYSDVNERGEGSWWDEKYKAMVLDPEYLVEEEKLQEDIKKEAYKAAEEQFSDDDTFEQTEAMDNFLADKIWVSGTKNKLLLEHSELYVNKKKIEEEISDKAYEAAEERLSDPENPYSQFEIEENFSGEWLSGNDESGWHNHTYGEMGYSLADAKERLIEALSDDGKLKFEFKPIKKDLIKWDNLIPNMPSQNEISRLAKEEIKKKTKRAKEANKQAKKDNKEYYDLLGTEEQFFDKKKIDSFVEAETLDAVRELIRDDYLDIANPSNVFSVKTKNPAFRILVYGSAETGFNLTVDMNSYLNKALKGASTITEAQDAAIKHLEEKGYVKEKEEKNMEAPAPSSEVVGPPKWKQYTMFGGKGGKNYREFLIKIPMRGDKKFHEGHWGEDNVVLHFRVITRYDSNGEPTILVVEEIQSLWHQSGRDYGYTEKINFEKLAQDIRYAEKNRADFSNQMSEKYKLDLFEESAKTYIQYADLKKLSNEDQVKYKQLDEKIDNLITIAEKNVPLAPFKDTEVWSMIAMKRIIRKASEEGFKHIYWTTGTEQAERYPGQLIKKVDKLVWKKIDTGYQIATYKDDTINMVKDVTADVLKKIVRGKGAYEKIINSPGLEGVVDVENLAILEEGMINFYDEMLPKNVNKLLANIDPSVKVKQTYLKDENKEDILSARKRDLHENSVRLDFEKRLMKSLEKEEKNSANIIKQFAPQKRSDDVLLYKPNEFPGTTFVILKDDYDKFGKKATVLTFNGTRVVEYSKELNTEKQIEEKLYDDMYIELFNSIHSIEEETKDLEKTLAIIEKENVVPAWGFEITDKIIEAAKKGFSHYQADKLNEARAKIENINGKAVITLSKNADRSSILHEMSHHWLEAASIYVKTGRASVSYSDDYDKIKKWLGVSEGKDTFTTEQHEKFARGFETYLMEGQAPSEGLRSVFSRVRKWITGIYKTARELNADLTNDIREVFDRMLATEEEITKAEKVQMTYNPKDLEGFPEEIKRRGMDLQEQAHNEAMSILLNQQMKELKKEHKALIEEEKNKSIAQQTELANMLPVYSAITSIKESIQEKKLNVKELSQAFLDDKLSEEKSVLFNNIAEIKGYSSGSELAQAIISSPDIEDYIKSQVDLQMSKLANLKDSEIIKDKALEAIHNEKTAELMALEKQIFENKVLGATEKLEISKRRKIDARAEAAAIKSQAKATLEAKDIKAATAFRTYYTAERNAAAKASNAVARGKYDQAAMFKKQQMINHALATEAIRIKKQVDKNINYLEEAQKKEKTLFKKQEHFFQVAELLKKFGFERSDYMSDERTESLSQWEERMDESTNAVNIPEWLLSETVSKNYKDLTPVQLQEITSAVKNITRVANFENRAFKLFDQADIKDIISSLVVETNKHAKDKYEANIEPGKFDREGSFLREYNINLKKITSVFNKLGGTKNQDENIWVQKLYRPVYEAQNYESKKMREINKGIEENLKLYNKKELNKMTEKQNFYQELGANATKMRLIVMALNMGTESNRQRLFETPIVGYKGVAEWNEQFVTDFLNKYLTKTDWTFVQKTWDLINSIWPDVNEMHKTLTGFEADKVDAMPFSVNLPDGSTMELKGGYFPLVADSRESNLAKTRQELDQPLYSERNPGWKASTKTGHLKGRTNAKYPVSLEILNLQRHFKDVIHDLAFRPTVIDMRRIIENREVESLITRKLGPEGFDYIKTWLKSVATGSNTDKSASGTFEKVARALRERSVINQLVGRVGVITQNVVNPILFWKAMPGFDTYDTVAGWLKSVLWYYPNATFNTPIAKSIMEYVFSRSSFMQDKHENSDYLIGESLRRAAGKDRWLLKFTQSLMGFTDELSNIPMWMQAYTKKLNEGKSESDAVYYADMLVNNATTSSRKIDQPGIMRGSEAQKLLAMYYSFINNEYNRWVNEFNIQGENFNPVRLMAFVGSRILFIYLSALAAGKLPEDDEEWKPFMAKEMIMYPVGFFPGVREPVGVVVDNALGRKSFGYKPSPAIGSIETIINAASGITKAAKQGEFTQKTAEQLAKLAGVAWPYPDQMNAWFFNGVDYLQGEMKPEGRDIFRRRPIRERD